MSQLGFEFFALGIALVALIIGALIAIFLYFQFRQTKYSTELHRVQLDHSRQALERQVERLYEQIYQDKGRWAELNHLLVDSVRARAGRDAEQTQGLAGVTRSFITSMGVDPDTPIEPKLVFVLTPLNKDEEPVYDTIRRVCQEIGLHVRRGDEVQISGPILPHIIKEILSGTLIVANINGRNPNVFYELGIAQSLGKPCLLVAKAPESVPFDLSQQQLILYKNERELEDRLALGMSRMAFSKNLRRENMPYYHVNKNAQANGDHEVHENGCGHQPNPENRLALGQHSSCHGAVREAKKSYAQSNGCYYCCNDCHTG